MKRAIMFVIAGLLAAASASAATRTSVKSGNYSDATVWSSGLCPTNGDTAVVANTHTVTFDTNQTAYASGITLTVNAGGTFQASTNAGTYVLKLAGNCTVASGGSYLVGSATTAYPTQATYRVAINGNISHTGAGLYGIYCAEPTYKTVKLASTAAIGATNLVIDTDLSGDLYWGASGSLVDVNDINQAQETERRTVAAFVKSGTTNTLRITAGLTAAKSTGAYIVIVTRNVAIYGTTYGGTGTQFGFLEQPPVGQGRRRLQPERCCVRGLVRGELKRVQVAQMPGGSGGLGWDECVAHLLGVQRAEHAHLDVAAGAGVRFEEGRAERRFEDEAQSLGGLAEGSGGGAAAAITREDEIVRIAQQRAQVTRRSVDADELRQCLDHAPGADGAGHVDGQGFMRVLIDDGQTLDLLAVGSNHDALLAVAFHMQDRPNVQRRGAFAVLLDFAGEGVRQLVAKLFERRFADELGAEEADRLRRQFVVRIEIRACGEMLRDRGHEGIHPFAGRGRDEHGVRIRIGQRSALLGREQVGLVEDDEVGAGQLVLEEFLDRALVVEIVVFSALGGVKIRFQIDAHVSLLR
jgi:hypothetical protein